MANKKDDDETLLEKMVDGELPESTETNVRYIGYAARLRTIMMSAHRYVAYTSDIGESFRPVAHPLLVRSAYGISWAYILGDVANESYKAYCHQKALTAPETKPATETKSTTPEKAVTEVGKAQDLAHDYRTIAAQRLIFQSLASMALPAFTIHSVVRYSGRALKDVRNATMRTWAPIGLGLAVVPALPYIFDQPVEDAVEWAFKRGASMVEKAKKE